jgi:hypothetical protein
MGYSFNFDNTVLEYTIQTKKRRFFWWWLLLLLPLLLLIRFEKNVYLKAINIQNNAPVSNAEVSFSYHRCFVYDKSKFLTDSLVKLSNKTNNQGITGFVKLKYSLYSYLFKHNSKAIITAKSSCYLSDTLQENFHSLSNNDTLIVKLKPTTLSCDFKVVDKDDNEALPNAKVIIESEFSDQKFIDSAITDASGKVMFISLVKCGIVAKVKASADGYYDDSIINKSTLDLLSVDINPNRLLKLKPIRKPIVFYVKDCITKVGLADVKATINFTYPGRNKKETVTVITNENGVGKGIYDSAALLALLHISGSKDFYKDGELAGTHKVREFIDSTIYPRSKKTFCLEPEPNPICFVNIDSLNGNPISGVTNEISITNAAKNVKKVTKLSGSNGEFCISINSGDLVSISSSFSPYYLPNNYTINNAKFEDLVNRNDKPIKIPLSPVLVDLTFKTIDAKDKSLVPQANLIFSTSPNDALIQPIPTNSGSGEFTLKTRLDAKISITASKQDYKTNNYTIVDKPVEYLLKSTEEEREIPMVKDDPPPTPCNTTIEGGGSCCGKKYFTYSMGSIKKFYIDFDHIAIGDEFWVYCGNQGSLGSELIHSDKRMYKSGMKNEELLVDLSNCNTTEVTVVVNVETANSSYKFKFKCP